MVMAGKDGSETTSYSTVACIGTGLSAIALGATLKRWYSITDVCFFDRNSSSGGTWWTNSYPGCACDIPSALYSFSFELNPGWTKLMPPASEISSYLTRVSEKYDLPRHMKFNTEVEECSWQESDSVWLLTLKDLQDGRRWTHYCKILVSAVGQLVQPLDLSIPGVETFHGPMFHSARWDHSVDLVDKKVIVIGNGCTAAQIIPAIAPLTKHLTQIVRSSHWIFRQPQFQYTPFMSWIFHHVPFAMRLQRLLLFLAIEVDFPSFLMTEEGTKSRKYARSKAESYMKSTAPQKYHKVLIPNYEVGCKRRIFDPGYLESLHRSNVSLINQEILEVLPQGIRTHEQVIEADVIILATGYKTGEFIQPMNVFGLNGISLQEHWRNIGGPAAYNNTSMHGFPNLFMIGGPNSSSGHTSFVMAAENAVNYALRVSKDVLRGHAKTIEVRKEAEEKYIDDIQEALKKTVWNTGCNSWYINTNKWNGVSYPWSQAWYWYKSLFPVWKDWEIRYHV